MNGVERCINFLPYPGNYGFIPSTLSKTDNGGDGDALDILVISETEPTGNVIETIPIVILKLIDNGETCYKVIAVSKEANQRIINVTSYTGLLSQYPKVIKIITLWFLNYNPNDSSSIERWGDEKEAL